MYKKLGLIFFLWPLPAKAADPQVLLEETVAMVSSGEERTWNNQKIGQKLREVRQNYSQTSAALDASALLAFYLSQIPGDHSKEIYELCDELGTKSPNSWQAWMANCAKIATHGFRKRENQKTLDIALDVLARTNGDELCKDPDAMCLIKPLMDQWPPVSTNFTDILNSVIVQQAFVLGQYELGKEHLSKILNPRIKAFGESCMTDYLRDHPEIPQDPPREKKSSSETPSDNNANEENRVLKKALKLTKPDS